MSWLYSRALVEEYSEAICSDGELSAQSKSTPMPQAYCAQDKMTAFSRLSRFGMIFAPLTEDRGAELLTLYLEASHAKTSASPGKAQASTESVPDCGVKCAESLARYDPDTHSLKTHQRSLFEDSTSSYAILPEWGLTVDGELLGLTPLVFDITEPDYGWLPTPTKNDHKGATTKCLEKKGTSYLRYWLHAKFPISTTTYPRPTFMEQEMAWPIGWTELAPLGMDKFRRWQQQHSEFYQANIEKENHAH